MNAQATDIQASTEFAISQTSKTSNVHTQHSDWSFLPTAAGGLAGVGIGIVLGTLLGLC